MKLFVLSVCLIVSFPASFAIEDFAMVGENPRDIEFDYVLNNIYVANYDSGTISIIDSEEMVVKETILLSDNTNTARPTKIAVDSQNHIVYVSDKISGVLTVIDGINGNIIKKMNLGGSLWDLEINEQRQKIYVSDMLNNKIIVVNTNDYTVKDYIDLSSSPWDIVIEKNTDTIYVATGISESIFVIDGKSDNVIDNIYTGIKPWGISVNEKNNLIYATSWDSDKITIIDKNHQTISEIQVNPGAWQITTNQNDGITMIANEHTNEIYLINENSAIFDTIIVSSSPQTILADPEKNVIYAANPLSNSVSSIEYAYDISDSPVNITKSEQDSLVFDVLDGLSKVTENNDVDKETVSKLLKNTGITGKFDGNEIANILLEDYDKKKDSGPKEIQVPSWTKELASMFSIGPLVFPDKVSCNDDSVGNISDMDNVNVVEIWLNILPICQFS